MTGHAGFFLGELVHPYMKFTAAGHVVTIASVSGGACHVAAASVGEPFYDDVCKSFWESDEKKALTQSTKGLSEYSGKDYDLIFYVGGYGTMSDFPSSPDVARVGEECYSKGGHLGFVCHGQSALFNMKGSDGEYIAKGKTVCSFTNEEEAAMGNPSLPTETLEDGLVKRGAIFAGGSAWSSTTVSSDRIHTGQNPASAGAVAAAIVACL